MCGLTVVRKLLFHSLILMYMKKGGFHVDLK